MLVMLLDYVAREPWLTESIDQALALQRSAAEDAVRIVASGKKENAPE